MQYAKDFGVSDGELYTYANSRQMCMRKEFPAIMNVSRVCEKYINGDEEYLKSLVAVQPVVIGYSVTVDFMYYKEGIFNDPTCTTAIDHALV